MRVAQRSCWAAAAMVSYSAASCAIDPHCSCSAVMVSWAESSAPNAAALRTALSGRWLRSLSEGCGVCVGGSGLSRRRRRSSPFLPRVMRDVEVLPRGRRASTRTWRGIDGDALRAVCGDRVAQVEVLGHIVGREHDGAAPAALGPRTVSEPSSRTSVTRPPVSPLRTQSGRPARRRRSLRRVMIVIPDSGTGAIAQVDFAVGVIHRAVEDQIGTRPGVQRHHGFVRVSVTSTLPARRPDRHARRRMRHRPSLLVSPPAMRSML